MKILVQQLSILSSPSRSSWHWSQRIAAHRKPPFHHQPSFLPVQATGSNDKRRPRQHERQPPFHPLLSSLVIGDDLQRVTPPAVNSGYDSPPATKPAARRRKAEQLDGLVISAIPLRSAKSPADSSGFQPPPRRSSKRTEDSGKRVAEASKLLLEVTQNAPKGTYSTTAEELHTLSQSTTEHDDAFWKNPDNIRALERAEQATLGIP
nr:hypothetical protein Iba_chr13fCG6610 [Ipomoea batatas]